MTEQNPEKTEDITVEPKEQENLLSNETLRELVDNPNKFDDLTPDQQQEFHSRFVEGEEEGVPTLEEEQAAQTQEPVSEKTGEPAEKAAPTTEPEAKTDDVDPEEQERRRKYKELRDENNTLTQKLKSMAKKAEELKKSKLEDPPALEQDEYDENAKKQAEWNKRMAESVNQKIDAEVNDVAQQSAQLSQEVLFSNVSLLQSENTELLTEKPIKALNNALVNFREQLAPGGDEEAKSKAVDDFLSNPEIRKAKEEQGVLFPFTDKDWKAFTKISEVNNFKRTGGDPSWDASKLGDKYPDLESAYHMYKKHTGDVPDPIKQAALDATTKVVEQVSGGQNQATTLSPDTGVTTGDGGMTAQQAEQWMIDHPTPSTPDEIRIQAEIHRKFVSPSPG